MILSFIQDTDSDFSRQAELIAPHLNAPNKDHSEKENDPVNDTGENSANETDKEQTGSEKTDRNKEPDRIQYSYDNSFESKYVHFKEKIEKDRLTWETFYNRK